MHTVIKIGIIIGIIITVLAAAGAALLYTLVNEIEDQMGIIPNEELEKLALTNVSYSDLVDNNDSYIGEIISESGKVSSIVEIAFGSEGYLIDAGGGAYYVLYDDDIMYDTPENALFYGTVAGLQTIELESGGAVQAVVLNNEDIKFSPEPFK